MLRAFHAPCLFGLLCCLMGLWTVDGLIEIVEEQRCHDYEFRLTCRDLDSHIAVLEAWYTALQHYQGISNGTHAELKLKTENDSELNRVYVYSSPKHNGVYEPTKLTKTNNSIVNVTKIDFNDTFLNDSLWLVNDTMDMSVELLNVSDSCGGEEFARSYASWRDDRRRKIVPRDASINLRAPVSYRLEVFNGVTRNLQLNVPATLVLFPGQCTGVNHCNFVVAEDYPPSVRWSPGVVFIKYACFDDTLSVHYCNREVRIAAWGSDSEGYIRTPGYPHFYVGDVCRWRLRVDPEQRVRVTMLDVSLRSLGPFDKECTDQVSVADVTGDKLFSSCDQVDTPLRLTSATNVVDVVVDARSKGAYPKRGVLLHYKSVGCVTFKAPSNGYLVYRNEDVAHYMCNVNYVFEDTRERARLLWCYDDNRWNDTVPSCIVEAAAAVSNDTVETATKMPRDEPSLMVDIVIPSLLIAALFIGNAFIVLIIYKYRKRKNEDLDDEFNTIPLNTNGNMHTAGNAV